MSEERDSATEHLPEGVIDRAEELTRQARRAVDEEASVYREDRDEMLQEYGYTARIRDEDREVLVLYPLEWVEDGLVVPERIDDLDRGIERPLEGPGETDRWETVERHNRDLARTVEREHGEAHGGNAHALADFMSNHYGKPIDDATGEELQEFLGEYYPRNAWPTEKQRAVVEQSLELVFERAGTSLPAVAER